MYSDALDKLLGDLWTPQAMRLAETDAGAGNTWEAIESSGFTNLLLPESEGGPGLYLQDSYELFGPLGRHPAPLPLASTWIARRHLPASQRGVGPIAVARAIGTADQTQIVCPRVPGGGMAGKVLVFNEERLALFDAQHTVTQAPVGDPRGQALRMTWHSRDALWQQDAGGHSIQAWMAAAAAAQISAALQTVFELSLTHCNQRRQFGKTIGQFQAVQHQLSVMAEHVLAASLAAELAFSTSGTGPQTLHAAIAKARNSEAVALVCASAHALHGAIGMTDEFVLGLYTRRLNEWRLDHGSESHWQSVIGAAVLADHRPVAGQLAAL